MYSRLQIRYLNEQEAIVCGPCVITGQQYELHVNVPGFERWLHKGALIQDAMPELSVDEREFLISGVAPGKGNRFVFGGLEDEPMAEINGVVRPVPDEALYTDSERIDELACVDDYNRFEERQIDLNGTEFDDPTDDPAFPLHPDHEADDA